MTEVTNLNDPEKLRSAISAAPERPTSAAIAPNARRVAVAGALLVLLLAAGRLWWLPAHASLNVNEGWNAGHVARLLGAGSLYPPPDALVANNYPPLSFVVVGVAARLVGDAIVAGRIVALLGQVATSAAVAGLVRRLTGEARWAAAGALLFALFGTTLLRPYLAMDDPQWLGQALMAGALLLLAGRRPAPAVIAAAALTVAGGLVKHNLVAAPAAATLWLLLVDRRAAAVWAGTGAVLATMAAAGLYLIWGPAVFADVLAPARSYSLARAAAHGGPLLLAVLPGAIAAWPLLAAGRVDRRQWLPVLLLATAVPVALVEGSGDGVAINAAFETVMALCVAVPAGCALRGHARWRWPVAAALPALALVPVALAADLHELIGRGAAAARARPFIRAIAAARGPVACDDQAICHWAGRRSALDFFAVKQRLNQGRVPALDAALDARAFALIAMRSNNAGWHTNRLIPAIRARYRPIYADGDDELLASDAMVVSAASRSRIGAGSVNRSRR